MAESKKILVTGAAGQIGTDLVPALREVYGNENVIASVHKTQPTDEVKNGGPCETIEILEKEQLREIVEKHDIDTIYHMASLLSGVGEQNPDLAWRVNMKGLKIVLDLAREKNIHVFWPSSIAAFGPNTPKINTPQYTIMDPNTVYGVTKVAGELLCQYYFEKFNVDVRSVRYPGIISWKVMPGGGTTDYAIDIFYQALKEKKYECFLKEDATLPMMYMPDAIKATIDIMKAPKESIKVKTSYNLTAVSFSPKEIADEIKKQMPEFEISYKPDFRQKIAESWPQTIDDSQARKDWGWKHKFGLIEMTKDMLEKIGEKLKNN